MSTFAKVIGVIALLAAGALGLAMSLCGGAFTLAALSHQGAVDFLPIAVPSLLAGLALLWGATRGLRAQLRKPPER